MRMVCPNVTLILRLAGTGILVCFPVEWAAHTPAAGIFGNPLARHERDVSPAKGRSRGASGSSFRHADRIEPLSLFLNILSVGQYIVSRPRRLRPAAASSSPPFL